MSHTETEQQFITRMKIVWAASAVHSESSLHQLSPFIGKLKSSIAKLLILKFTKVNDLIYDPYCGSGTVPLEALLNHRKIICNDLNPYAILLTKAKLFPPCDLDLVLEKIEKVDKLRNMRSNDSIQREIPKWVADFFHPKTLLEIIDWVEILTEQEDYFLLACLMGILHHQRPGFLSFPSSHSVPYLRKQKFPPEIFPELYDYRNVKERLIKKAKRAFKRTYLTEVSTASCYNENANNLLLKTKIDNIITSPPYMKSLDYARDNRLRLWFLNTEVNKSLEDNVSPTEKKFLSDITNNLTKWHFDLNKDGKCILILGDSYCKSYKMQLPDAIEKIATEELKLFRLTFKIQNEIPEKNRVRRSYRGNESETILVFEKLDEDDL